MGFLVCVSKTDHAKVASVSDQLTDLCEGILERDDHFIYIPLAGKVIPVLKLFADHNITYELKHPPHEFSAMDGHTSN